MKNLIFNKKALYALLLTGTISLNAVGCTRDIIKRNKENNRNNTTIEETEANQEIYYNKYNAPVYLHELNDHAYILIDGDNKYTLCKGANIYFKGEWNIIDEEINSENIVVNAISSNGKYTLVKLPTDEKAYVESGYLVKCVNVHKTEYYNHNTYEDVKLLSDTYLYDDNGMYVDYLHCGEPCKVLSSNGEYAFIELQNGVKGYVLDRLVINAYQRIDGFGFINTNTLVYRDRELTRPDHREKEYKIVNVLYTTDKCVAITLGNDIMYVNLSDICKNFIDININTQRMCCYLDYQLAAQYPVRTGADKSPTHALASAIDIKYTDFTFEKYPDCKAKYAIAYDEENEEMIHDLVGDDEKNYGNSSYHKYGSGGCNRTILAGSKFVYDNYNVGDMVLVRKK